MTNTNPQLPQLTTVEESVAYVRYARKTTPGQYQSAEASVSFPVTIPEGGVLSSDLLRQINEAMGNAKIEVLTTLGVEYEVDEHGNVREKPQAVQPAPQPQQEPKPSGRWRGPQPQPSGGGQPPAEPGFTAVAGGGVPPCGVCGGKVWDNRQDKRNPKAPDFKCRDKNGCGAAMWLNEDGSHGAWKA